MKKFDVLTNGLKKEISKRKISFHSPGHKGKIDMMNEDFFEMDYTTDVDNGVVKNNAFSYLTMSQNQAANLYRSERVFYLAAGVQSGIYTMLTLCVKEGDKIIVDRNCDKSVIDAIILLGLIPVFITGTYIPKYDFYAGITVDDIKEAVEQHPDVKAVFITSPSWYGVVADIKSIALYAHEIGMYVLVDESMGGHFSFSQRLPASSSRLGADFTVQSLGKTLGSLCGTAVLHVNTNDFVSAKVYETLEMYQTSEPSYALYSIAEKSVYKAFSLGRRYKTLIDAIHRSAQYVNKCTKAYWIDADIKDTVFDVDFTKIVINFANTNLKGYDVARILNEKYSIEVEMCDDFNITCMVTAYNRISDVKRLAKAIVAIVDSSAAANKDAEFVTRNPVHNLKILPRDAFFAEGENVEIANSIGRISKNIVSKRSGGAPVLVPGEEITETHIKAICELNNTYVCGIREGGIIEVVKKS